MKKIYVAILWLIGVSFLVVLPAKASLFIDSWGVTPGAWAPVTAPSNVSWVTEDFTGSGPGYLDPGYGGQPFDAEAAYIGLQGSSLYIAIITGMSQSGSKDPWRYDNPGYTNYDWNQSLEKYWYDPGDIGIDIGGNGTYDFAITTRSSNSKSSYAPTPGAGMLLSGNLVWENPKAWDHGSQYTDWGGISDPWAVAEYDNAMDLGAAFSYSAFGIGHYAIETVLDMSLLGLNEGDILNMHWVMECGNDNINLSAEIPTSVPEPSTLMLLAAGFSGVVYWHRKIK